MALQLNPWTRREIAQRHYNGESSGKLSRIYGCTTQQISHIRKKWKIYLHLRIYFSDIVEASEMAQETSKIDKVGRYRAKK